MHTTYFVYFRQDTIAKLHRIVVEEKKPVRFGHWDAKEVNAFINKLIHILLGTYFRSVSQFYIEVCVLKSARTCPLTQPEIVHDTAC